MKLEPDPNDRWLVAKACVVSLTLFFCFSPCVNAQPTTNDQDVVAAGSSSTEEPTDPPSRLNFRELVFKGGFLMIPIAMMSVLVVCLVIERFFALRHSRLMPKALIDNLSRLATEPGLMDPRAAYRVCQENSSVAASVIRSMLLKVGRPQSEVEKAIADASQREASRLYENVRWLNLAAAITPLMGLLGTVWGMIQAFFRTTQLQAGQNKADYLAEGIYGALVTTLGGLSVAIPAAIFAHYFEGRIQQMFHRVDELAFNLAPQVERFEGKMRVSPQDLEANEETQE